MIYLFVLSLIGLLYPYIIYPAILYIMYVYNKKSYSLLVKDKKRRSLSVIIAAYNEEKNIKARIENLLASKNVLDNVEILIGSDGSTDRTNEIISQYKDQGVLLFGFPKRRGKAAVLNDLVAAAKNEILVFTDANTSFKDDVLLEFSQYYADESIGGVCGHLFLKSDKNNSGGRGEMFYWGLENILKQWEGTIYTTFGATGAIYSIRKQLFSPLPTDRVIVDDLLVPLQVVERGYRIIYDGSIKGWEHTTESSYTELHRKIRISAGNFNGISKIKNLLNPRRGFVAFGLWSHKIFRWVAPFFIILLFISNMVLFRRSEVYEYLFYIQCIFYIVGILGMILDFIKKPIFIFTLPFYFVLANMGLLFGFIKFVSGTQKATWNSTR